MAEWVRVILQTLVAVIFLFVLMRILGKRQISQLSLYEYVTGITIGSLAAYVPLELGGKWHLGLISLTVWVSVVIAIEYLQLKGKRIRDWLDGRGRVLIKNGKLLDENLKKERITVDELLVQLRQNNIYKISDVEFAVMEPNGSVNALLTKENQPITAKMLGLNVGSEEETQLVVVDGTIRDEGLSRQGVNRGWLQQELDKMGVALENVFAAQVDSDGQLFVDLYDDQIEVPVPQEKALILATLKKCEADIEMFGLSTDDQKSKKMYQNCSAILQQEIEQIKPYLMN